MREVITELHRAQALKKVEDWLDRAIRLKGEGAFASFHEMRGAISEEYQELMDALYQRSSIHVERELKDLAVVAIFGLACLKAGTLP